MAETQGEPSADGGHPLPAIQHMLDKRVTDPEPGQIWRASWGDVADIGLVTQVEEPWIVIAPVGDDAEYAEPATVLADSSVLGFPITIWPQLAIRIPMAALEFHLGDVPEVPVATAGERRPFATGLADQQSRYRDALQQRWESMAEAAADVVPDASDVESGASVRDTLEGAGYVFDDLTEVVEVQAALSLWRGERAPTEPEAKAIGSRTGIPVDRWSGGIGVPAELVAVLNHPRYRRRIRQRAAATKASENAVHHGLHTAALARAARESGGQASERDRWAGFVDHELGL